MTAHRDLALPMVNNRGESSVRYGRHHLNMSVLKRHLILSWSDKVSDMNI